MKAVILAGGYGTRIAEETHLKPKPMIEIGGKPILWHILKHYASYGINEFVICCGYRGYQIKEYFANYFLYMSDVTFNLTDNSVEVHHKEVEPWRVTLVDTGESTQTGGRLKRVAEFLEEEVFCLTYGDGVGNIDIASVIDFHQQSGKLVTLTAVQPPGRFGAVNLRGNSVESFVEKPRGDGAQINGGYFVVNRECLELIEGDEISWENHVLPKLAGQGEVAAYHHHGFWHPMDTLRDKNYLNDMWAAGEPLWKTWN